MGLKWYKSWFKCDGLHFTCVYNDVKKIIPIYI